jgi:hypothetical protein
LSILRDPGLHHRLGIAIGRRGNDCGTRLVPLPVPVGSRRVHASADFSDFE